MPAGQMKLLSGFMALFLCWAGNPIAHAGGSQGFLIRYLSPLPDSRYILPGSNIIIRTDRPIGADAALTLVQSVTGARSGIHRLAVRVSDDGYTVTCQPDHPFAEGEEVTVQIDTAVAQRGSAMPGHSTRLRPPAAPRTSQCSGNGYDTDPHELRMLPNGHALLLGVDEQVFDMSQFVPGGYSFALVVGSTIQELDRDKNVVFQWRSWDHFRVTDAMHIDLTGGWIDYVHGNALDEQNKTATIRTFLPPLAVAS